MKKEVTKLTPFSCDCCGYEFGEYDENAMCYVKHKEITHTEYTNGDVSYEAKVLGDYCENCFDVLVRMANISDVFMDRYDSAHEDSLRDEIDRVVRIVWAK